jgi:hypothetical protein
MAVTGLCSVAAVAGCTVLIAACGAGAGSGTGTGTTNSQAAYSAALRLATCMRAHGVTNFPDPTATSGGEGFPGGVIRSNTGTLVVNGITFSGPVAEAAEKACARFLMPTGPPPQPTAQQRQAMLASARCMRTHGVPSFPDPRFSRAGPRATGPPAAVDPNSPAFKHAAAACGGSQRRLAVSP